MKTGRPTKPEAVKDATGNPGKRRRVAASSDAVTDAGGALRPPAKLSRSGQAVWRQVVPELEAMRFVRITDRHALARYCDALERWWDVSQKIRKEGVTYVSQSNHGELKRINPLFMIEERLVRRLTELEDRFGLSPAARQSILSKMAQQQPSLPLTPAASQDERAEPQHERPADPMLFFTPTHQGTATPQ